VAFYPDEAITVDALIEKLLKIPGSWRVRGTGHGSLRVDDPGSAKYGYVFISEHEAMFLTDLKWRSPAP
jgi:hypothetical protein